MTQQQLRESIRKRMKYAGIDKGTRAKVMTIIDKSLGVRPRIDPGVNGRMDDIIRRMASVSGISISELHGRCQTRRYSNARMLCEYIMFYDCSPSIKLVNISRKFDRNHSTVKKNIATIKNLIEVSDPSITLLYTEYQQLTAPAGSGE